MPVVSTESTAPDVPSAPWLDFLIRRRYLLLVLTLLLTALATIPASQLTMDESIESFYAEGDPLLVNYERSSRLFGGDEFVLVAYRDQKLYNEETSSFQQEALDELQAFSKELSEVPGVDAASTQNLASMLTPTDASLMVRLFLRFPASKRNIVEFARNMLIGEDNKTTAIILRLLPLDETTTTRGETFRRIREVAQSHDPPAYVAGEPVQVHDMYRYVEQDATTLGLASSILLLIVIYILFRSVRWMLLPLLVVQVTLIWAKAALVLFGFKTSVVSSMLTSLVTIIGIATVTHVTVVYREKRHTLDRPAAVKATFAELAAPVFWTIVTTAIGFLALLSSSISPVRNFAVMMAVGTLLVLPVVLGLLPAGILLGSRDADPKQTRIEDRLLRGLGRISEMLGKRGTPILILAFLVMALGGWGLTRLQVETDFSKNFRASSPIVQALTFFETHLGGAGTWQVDFPAPAELDREYIDKVRNLSNDLMTIKTADGTGLTKTIAYSDGLDFIPRIAARSIESKEELLRDFQPQFEQGMYHRGEGRMRIVLRALEQQPAEVKLALIDAVERKARETFPDAHATGLYVILANLISSLLDDQVVSFLYAALGIFVAVSIALRDIRIGLIALVPNVFPILLVIGGMGWLDVPINIGTAMIASVSMGLTVDSSIHYLFGYRRARSEGLDHFAAVKDTHGSVGRALVFANIALIVGFSVLSLSNFIPLVYFGLLVSVAMLGGLLGNLVVLPVMLRWVPMRG